MQNSQCKVFNNSIYKIENRKKFINIYDVFQETNRKATTLGILFRPVSSGMISVRPVIA